MKFSAPHDPETTRADTRSRRGRGLLLSCAALAVALLAGCAAKVTRSDGGFTPLRATAASPVAAKHLALRMGGHQGSGWDKFVTEWQEALRDQAAAAGMSFEYLASATATPATAAGTLLDVTVVDYRQVSPGTRFMFGIMTGNAFLDAKVSFVDIASGQEIANKRYGTSSSAREGVASAMTDRQVRAVAAQIIGDVSAARPSSSVPRVVAARPVTAAQGRDAFSAERLAKANSCSAEPLATLAAKGPGFETYTVACTNGDVLSVRCESGNCRLLQ